MYHYAFNTISEQILHIILLKLEKRSSKLQRNAVKGGYITLLLYNMGFSRKKIFKAQYSAHKVFLRTGCCINLSRLASSVSQFRKYSLLYGFAHRSDLHMKNIFGHLYISSLYCTQTAVLITTVLYQCVLQCAVLY